MESDYREVRRKIRTNAGLELQSVTKRFGSVTAVNELSLTAEEGEFVTLLGPSGCGKTTMLRMIAGFLSPDDGRILIDGQDVSRVPPQRRNVGMVFQNYALFPHLTVAENVEFPLRERRVPKEERRRITMEYLELVQLPLPNRYPAELSGGQQQRVALARALCFQPQILLLDEPLGALDVKLRETMQIEIRRLQRKLKITTLYVTHDQQEALSMADRIVVMKDGTALQIGRPSEIYEAPSSQFVAQFVGKTNFFEGKVIDEFTIQTDRGFRLIVSTPIRATAGEAIRLAVRPEAMRLARDGIALSNVNSLPGVIVEKGYMGHRQYCHVRVEDTTVVVELPGREKGFSPGDRVLVAWSPDEGLILPEDSTLDRGSTSFPDA